MHKNLFTFFKNIYNNYILKDTKLVDRVDGSLQYAEKAGLLPVYTNKKVSLLHLATDRQEIDKRQMYC